MYCCAAKKARFDDSSNNVESKSEDKVGNSKQTIQKGERKEKSKSKKGDGKLQNVQAQTEASNGKLQSKVLVLPCSFFCITEIHFSTSLLLMIHNFNAC